MPHMAPSLLLFFTIFFITRLPGAAGVSTVSNVVVQSGGSVTIPCHYEREYENNVKYLCLGHQFYECTVKARSDSPKVNGKVSITDDPAHHVFTVTMTNLQMEDSAYYWCAIERKGPDDGARLHMSVTAGAAGVSSVSTVAVQSGGSVTIPCLYNSEHKNNVKYWCRGYGWNGCSTVIRTDSPKGNGKVSITDDRAHHVFTVTMTNLKKEDSEYYWCAVERSGADVGTHLYLSVTAGTPDLWVDKQEVTGVEGDSVSVQCHYSNYDSSVKKWCRIRGPCVEGNSGKDKSEIRDDRDHNVFTVMMRRLERKDTGWYWCAAGYLQIPVHITVTQRTTAVKVTTAAKSSTSPTTTPVKCCTTPPVTTATTFIQASTSQWKTTKTLHPPSPATTEPKQSPPVIPVLPMAFGTLLLLLLLLLVVTATWKLWRKRKNVQTKTNGAEDRRDYPTMTLEPDVTYSTVMTKRKDKVQTKGSEDQVTYSAVFINTGSSRRVSPPQSQLCEEPEDEVTYSTIVLHNPQPAANTSNDVTYSTVARKKKQRAAR